MDQNDSGVGVGGFLAKVKFVAIWLANWQTF